MKKIISYTACISLFSVILAGCGAINNFKEKNSGFIAGMPNPWTGIDEKQASEAAGFAFVLPENADKGNFRMMKMSNMVEMSFSMPGAECTARTMPSKKMEDISGMYYDWDIEKKGTVLGFSGEERFTKEGNKYIFSGVWHNKGKGRTYSLSCICDNADKGQSCSAAMAKGISAAVFANAAE